MTRSSLLRLSAAAALALGSAVLSAQQAPQLPSQPALGFGGAVTPAFEGWFDNPDGTHNFLIGYYSRNTKAEIDVPIGPNNKFDTPNPDQGQPTHFLTRRRYGMFVVTVPKEFPRTQKIYWTVTANGSTSSVPFHMHTDYNITPTKSTEESPTREFNLPPKLRLAPDGPQLSGPFATMAKAVERTATVGTPMPLEMWADDDAQFSSGGNGPMNESRPILVPLVSKYPGTGNHHARDQQPGEVRDGVRWQAASALLGPRLHDGEVLGARRLRAAHQHQRLLRQRWRRVRLLLDDDVDEGEGDALSGLHTVERVAANPLSVQRRTCCACSGEPSGSPDSISPQQ